MSHHRSIRIPALETPRDVEEYTVKLSQEAVQLFSDKHEPRRKKKRKPVEPSAEGQRDMLNLYAELRRSVKNADKLTKGLLDDSSFRFHGTLQAALTSLLNAVEKTKLMIVRNEDWNE